MNLKALKKPQLLELAKELRLDVTDALRKPELIQAILAVGADDDELSECIELINDRETAKRQAEAERQREELERQEPEERKRVQELEWQRQDQERKLKHEEKMRWYDLDIERIRRERKKLERERLQRENKYPEHEIQLEQEVKPELELLLGKDLVVEESSVPALPVADARERESEVTVAAPQRVKVAERDNDGALAQTVGRGGRGQCVSTECDNVSAFVLEISAECSDGSNSREALGMATDLNMNISRDSEVSLECVNHGATERQHESAETEVVPSDGSTETSDVVAKPAVEAASGLHSSAGSRDDLTTEQADSVLPPAQVADHEQRPAELVEIQVSGAAEPSFENQTEQPRCSVVLAVRKQNGNTLRASLAEAVAVSARDDEVVTVRSYPVPKELVVPVSLPVDSPDDKPIWAKLVEISVAPVAEPKSGTDQPRGENVNTFRCSLAERVGEKASKKDRGKISARTCGACFSAGTPRGKAMSSHRAKGTPPPRRSARLTFERWKISLAPPRARPLSKTTAGAISRGRSSVQRTGTPKVRYKLGKARSNDESSNRGSQREKWLVDA